VRAADRSGIALAIVRADLRQGPYPFIHVVSVDELFGPERVLLVTTSTGEAVVAIQRWLEQVAGPGPDRRSPSDPVTPT